MLPQKEETRSSSSRTSSSSTLNEARPLVSIGLCNVYLEFNRLVLDIHLTCLKTDIGTNDRVIVLSLVRFW